MQSTSYNMNENIRSSSDQLSKSFSVEALQEIVRNYQRSEQCLHELRHHTRNERKKAERLLYETYRTKQQHNKQKSTSQNNNSKLKQQKPIEFFISFDDNNNVKNNNHHIHKKTNKKQQEKNSTTSILNESLHLDHSTTNNNHRVRFNIPTDHSISSNKRNNDDELTDLSRRCEDLLLRLQTHRKQTKTFENHDYHTEKILSNSQDDKSITLQQSLELLRPEFISNSRQRIQHINHLRKNREHQQINPLFHTNSNKFSSTYQNMKEITKKKYEQLPEVNHRSQQGLISEIQRRNYLRAKIFQIRLRQHVLLHGRTNINESLTMID